MIALLIALALSTSTQQLYGNCRITFYCPCSSCCGEWAGGATASGVMPTANHTVAADLPFGTRLLIDGEEYIVEDRGVSGMCVDIFVDSHEEALQRGLYYTDIYIMEDTTDDKSKSFKELLQEILRC